MTTLQGVSLWTCGVPGDSSSGDLIIRTQCRASCNKYVTIYNYQTRQVDKTSRLSESNTNARCILASYPLFIRSGGFLLAVYYHSCIIHSPLSRTPLLLGCHQHPFLAFITSNNHHVSHSHHNDNGNDNGNDNDNDRYRMLDLMLDGSRAKSYDGQVNTHKQIKMDEEERLFLNHFTFKSVFPTSPRETTPLTTWEE